MSLTCMVGATATWDAVAYVRNLIEDTNAASFVIPDTAFGLYIEAAAEEYSRLVPLDIQLGNVYAQSSPFVTVLGQQRYVCNAGNGFTLYPMRITDILYRAVTSFSAVNELAYLFILPFSPINKFLFTPNLLDEPTIRILRDQYLSELDHYGKGFAGVARDSATGMLAIDLYPVPTANLPVYVRYQAMHANTGNFTSAATYPTVPEDKKRSFGDLLYSIVLDQECDRIAKYMANKAGLLDIRSDPRTLREMAGEVRERVWFATGAEAAVASVSY